MKKRIALLIVSFACVCAIFSSCASEKESKIVTEEGKLIAKAYSSREAAQGEYGWTKECDLTLTVGKEEKTNVGIPNGAIYSTAGVMVDFEYDGADLYFDAEGGRVSQLVQIQKFETNVTDLTPEIAVSSPCHIVWKCLKHTEGDVVIKIIAKQGSDIVGAARLKMHYELSDTGGTREIPVTYMTLEKSVSFPKVKGKAQNITEEYLNEFFAAA